MCFGLRLPQKLISEISQSRGSTHIVALLVVAIDILCTAVNDGLLALCEMMPCDYLLAKRLEELGFFDNRIHFTIVLVHIHGIYMIRRCCRYFYHRAAKGAHKGCVLAFRV